MLFIQEMTNSYVVGYSTRKAPKASFRLAGIQFKTCSGTYSLQELAPVTSTVWADDEGVFDLEAAPQLMVQQPNSVNYDWYYFINNAMYTNDGGETIERKAGWADSNGILCTPAMFKDDLCLYSGVITPGVGMWFKHPNQDNAFVSNGQVVDADVDVTCPAGFRLRTGSHPINANLNDPNQMSFAGLAEVWADDEGVFNLDAAPQLQVQKADGSANYDWYYFIQNAMYTNDGGETIDRKAGWADSNGILCTPEMFKDELCLYSGIIPAGNGMWVSGVSKEFTMTFKNPVK